MKGVYAVRAGVDQGAETVWHDGVANFGNRPTFDKTDTLLEVHLFDFAGDLYGAELRVRFHAKLRDERKFASAADLADRIRADRDEARVSSDEGMGPDLAEQCRLLRDHPLLAEGREAEHEHQREEPQHGPERREREEECHEADDEGGAGDGPSPAGVPRGGHGGDPRRGVLLGGGGCASCQG